MLIHGFWDRDVLMMSLAVTDLIYRRSILAWLRSATDVLVLESAGQTRRCGRSTPSSRSNT
ncbi:MAG: hypothetical protein IPO89_01545 [Actinomycetales bacterium]|nr:hypothetical protein [Candidatus Lutibacillus vidarii]